MKVERWKRRKEIGRGGFGIVYLEEDGTGKCRAVKEVPKMMGRESTIDPLREITAMASFSKIRRHRPPHTAYTIATPCSRSADYHHRMKRIL